MEAKLEKSRKSKGNARQANSAEVLAKSCCDGGVGMCWECC